METMFVVPKEWYVVGGEPEIHVKSPLDVTSFRYRALSVDATFDENEKMYRRLATILRAWGFTDQQWLTEVTYAVTELTLNMVQHAAVEGTDTCQKMHVSFASFSDKVDRYFWAYVLGGTTAKPIDTKQLCCELPDPMSERGRGMNIVRETTDTFLIDPSRTGFLIMKRAPIDT